MTKFRSQWQGDNVYHQRKVEIDIATRLTKHCKVLRYYGMTHKVVSALVKKGILKTHYDIYKLTVEQYMDAAKCERETAEAVVGRLHFEDRFYPHRMITSLVPFTIHPNIMKEFLIATKGVENFIHLAKERLLPRRISEYERVQLEGFFQNEEHVKLVEYFTANSILLTAMRKNAEEYSKDNHFQMTCNKAKAALTRILNRHEFDPAIKEAIMMEFSQELKPTPRRKMRYE